MQPADRQRPLRVAIVGAGPAGIYAADVLMKSEHRRVDRPVRAPARAVRPDPLRRRAGPPAHQGHRQGAAPGAVQAADPPARQRRVRHRRQARRPAPPLRRGRLHDRRREGPRPRHPRHRPAGQLRRRGLRQLVRRPPGRAARVAARGRVRRGRRRRQRRPRRRPHARRRPPTSCSSPRSPTTCTRASRPRPVREVHVFARRGPAQAKFTPLELRELDHSPNVEVLVAPEDIEYDDGSVAAHQQRQPDPAGRQGARALRDAHRRERRGRAAAQAVAALLRVARRGPRRRQGRGLPHRAHRATPATATSAAPASSTTGPSRRCTGASATAPPSCPACRGTAATTSSRTAPAACWTWTARRSRASTSTAGSSAVRSASSATPRATRSRPSARCSRTSRRCPSRPSRRPRRSREFLQSRGVAYTTWDGWQLLDAHELALGEAYGLVGEKARERVKVVDRADDDRVSRAVQAVEAGEPGAEQQLDEALEAADEQIAAATPQV